MRTIPWFRRGRLFAVTAIVLISACASTPDIRRDTNPSARFGAYKTFAFYSPLATDTGSFQTLLTTHLMAATRGTMESKGYVFSESSPDLLINFYVNIENRQDIRTTTTPSSRNTWGYYGFRRGRYTGFNNTTTVQVVNYRQGTLTIDLIDAKQNTLSWTATAEGRVSSSAARNPGPEIDTLVADMMAPLVTVH